MNKSIMRMCPMNLTFCNMQSVFIVVYDDGRQLQCITVE